MWKFFLRVNHRFEEFKFWNKNGSILCQFFFDRLIWLRFFKELSCYQDSRLLVSCWKETAATAQERFFYCGPKGSWPANNWREAIWSSWALLCVAIYKVNVFNYGTVNRDHTHIENTTCFFCYLQLVRCLYALYCISTNALSNVFMLRLAHSCQNMYPASDLYRLMKLSFIYYIANTYLVIIY